MVRKAWKVRQSQRSRGKLTQHLRDRNPDSESGAHDGICLWMEYIAFWGRLA